MSLPRRNKIPRNVVAMGLVSLFNDIASEMVYPIVPIFLSTVLMAPAEIIGLIEGVAEATASLLKIISGWLSDRFHRRKIFVTLGYGLSSLSKLVLGFARSWHFVLGARFMDRFGKGTRESARDALIMESTPAVNRGRAFGLHRALDSLGAVIGPLLALLLLNFYHEGYSIIFFIAFIPSAIGVLLLLAFVRERARIKPETSIILKTVSKSKLFSFKWHDLDRNFKIFLFISVIFGIGNSSDAFLILRAQNLGLPITLTVATYVLFNFAYSAFSYPAGAISDKIGSKKVLTLGFWLFALVYLSFGFIHQGVYVWLLFPLYGIYMALTDGVSRAYISDMVSAEKSATAFGAYQTLVGFSALVASLIAGWLWQTFSPSAPFIGGGVLALIAAISFMSFKTLKVKI